VSQCNKTIIRSLARNFKNWQRGMESWKGSWLKKNKLLELWTVKGMICKMNLTGRHKLGQNCSSNSLCFNKILDKSRKALISDNIALIRWSADSVKQSRPVIQWNDSLKGSAKRCYKLRIDWEKQKQQPVNLRMRLAFWLYLTKKGSKRHNV